MTDNYLFFVRVYEFPVKTLMKVILRSTLDVIS